MKSEESSTDAYRPTPSLARNVAALVDNATPYRDGQMSLAERALYRRPGWHGWSGWVFFAASVCLLAATYVK